MGRVGKELSTSRVVAGQTLLVGAANISLTPWQTNLTFVRASSPSNPPRRPYQPLRLLLYATDFLLLVGRTGFFSRGILCCFPKFPGYLAFPSTPAKKKRRNTFLSIVIISFAFPTTF